LQHCENRFALRAWLLARPRRRVASCCTPSPARANATVSLATARGLVILVAPAPLPLPLCTMPVFVRQKADAPLRAVGLATAPPPSAAATSSSTPATSCAASSAAPPPALAEGRASACASASATPREGGLRGGGALHCGCFRSFGSASPGRAVSAAGCVELPRGWMTRPATILLFFAPFLSVDSSTFRVASPAPAAKKGGGVDFGYPSSSTLWEPGARARCISRRRPVSLERVPLRTGEPERLAGKGSQSRTLDKTLLFSSS